MKYFTCNQFNTEKLDEQVNECLKKGCVLRGDQYTSTVRSKDGKEFTVFCQVVVKE